MEKMETERYISCTTKCLAAHMNISYNIYIYTYIFANNVSGNSRMVDI